LQREDYEAIFSLEDLTRLNLALNNLTDDDLAGVEQLQNLDSLDLQYNQISDRSVERLAQLSGLTRLNLTGTDVTPAGAASLAKAIPGATIIHRSAPSPNFRQAVIRLHATGSYGQDTRGGGMRLMLRSDSWKRREQDIPLLAELVDVESVSMQNFEITPPLLDALAELPILRRMMISDMSLEGSDLSPLGKSKSLRMLRFSAAVLDGKCISSLNALNSLESLAIFNSRLTGGGQQAFASLSNVQVINVRQVVLEDPSLEGLLDGFQESENLRMLELVQGEVTDRDIPRLASLRQLFSLGLNLTKVSDASVPQLATMTGLLQLDITGSQISTAGLTQLQTALPDCHIVHQASLTARYQIPQPTILQLGNERARIEALITAFQGESEPDTP
jgi:hypothetical protein